MMIPDTLTPRQQARVMAMGFFTVVFMGTAACIALILLVFWLISQVFLLLIESSIEALSYAGMLYAQADPLIKFCLLACCSYAVYRVFKHLYRRVHQ